MSEVLYRPDKVVRALLEVVSSCVHCGAPIYGRRTAFEDEVPVIWYSCSCWRRAGVADNKPVNPAPLAMETK